MPSLNTELAQLFNADTKRPVSTAAAAAGDVEMRDEERGEVVANVFVESRIDSDDSFAVMARRNLDFFRAKFDKLLQ